MIFIEPDSAMLGDRDRPGRRAVRPAPPFPSVLHHAK
jgi:hypothetical protein